MAKLRDDLDELAAQVRDLQTSNAFLLHELALVEGTVVRLTQTNAALVEALNNTWTVLDRLTGRTAILRREEHQHEWQAVRDAVFTNDDALLGYGVTEKCPCGAVRSRMTLGRSLVELEAA